MPQEIERKFLLKRYPNELPVQKTHLVFQGYLSIDPDYEVRISNRLNLTTKSGYGIACEENIYNLSRDIYDALAPLTKNKQIWKTRNWFKLGSGRVAEVDTYQDKNIGIQTVEVEFDSVEEANLFQPPDWFGEDVTNNPKYKNANLAK